MFLKSQPYPKIVHRDRSYVKKLAGLIPVHYLNFTYHLDRGLSAAAGLQSKQAGSWHSLIASSRDKASFHTKHQLFFVSRPTLDIICRVVELSSNHFLHQSSKQLRHQTTIMMIYSSTARFLTVTLAVASQGISSVNAQT